MNFKLPIRSAILSCAVALGTLIPFAQANAVTCFSERPVHGQFLITSNFGWRFQPKLKIVREHKGADLRAGLNTQLFAVESGMAIFRTGWENGGGNTITILGNSGTITVYRHLQVNYVKTGDKITAGQMIGLSGNTGAASMSPHLHFEVRKSANEPVDPRPYLCNPPEKPDAGPDPKLNPGAAQPGTAAASTVTNGIPNNDYPPTGTAVGAASTVSQASSMPDYSGMSLREFLAAESSRRFGNPQWYHELNDPLYSLRNHPDPQVREGADSIPIGDMRPMLWREILFMMNLSNFYAFEKRDSRERIEEMLATELSSKASDYSTRLLSTMRSQASKLTNN